MEPAKTVKEEEESENLKMQVFLPKKEELATDSNEIALEKISNNFSTSIINDGLTLDINQYKFSPSKQ